MEELFDLGQNGPERTDISLCIFPHLKEFLAIDLRSETPGVTLLNAEDIFGGAFFDRVEHGFSHLLREPTEHPFAQLIDLPLRVEELARETGMLSILDRLGRGEGEDEFPTVAVFIISGAALSMTSPQISHAFRSLLGEDTDSSIVGEWSDILVRLIAEEHEVVKRIDQQELRDALEDQSPNFFTLWERRN